MIKYDKLDNGLRVVTETMPEVLSATIAMCVEIGARDEDFPISGTSHFLEHLLFKGTSSRSSFEIAQDLDLMGGISNAATSVEQTTYYIKIVKDDIEDGLALLMDIISDPAFRDEEIETERQVILEEISMHEDNPASVCWDNLISVCYDGSLLGKSIQGTTETINNITRQDIKGFWDSNYSLSNIIVASAGAVNHDYMLDKLSVGLNSRPTGKKIDRQIPKFNSGQELKLTKDFAQTTVMLAYESIEKKDDRRNPLTILNTVFGGSYSSRLFQEVREKLGLVYSIDAGWMGNVDCGISVISYATGPQNVDTVLKVVQVEVDKIIQDGIAVKELELAKRSIKAEVAMSFETSSSRMSRISSMVSVHDTVYSIEEQLQRLLEVTLDDVIAVARDIFSQPYTICQVGP